MGVAERPCSTRRPFSDPPDERPNAASGWFGGGLGDPECVETRGRDDALVVAVVDDDHRPVEAEGVEVGPGGRETVVEVAPPDAAHPLGVRFGRRLGEEGRPEPVHVGDSGQVGPPRMQRGDGEVVVRVDEAGEQGPPAEVDRHRIAVTGENPPFPHRCDPVVLDHERLRDRADRVHRVDRPSGEQGGRQLVRISGRDGGPWGDPSHGGAQHRPGSEAEWIRPASCTSRRRRRRAARCHSPDRCTSKRARPVKVATVKLAATPPTGGLTSEVVGGSPCG